MNNKNCGKKISLKKIFIWKKEKKIVWKIKIKQYFKLMAKKYV